jgi:hypothetical protein
MLGFESPGQRFDSLQRSQSFLREIHCDFSDWHNIRPVAREHVWYGLVRFGVVWFGAVWCGLRVPGRG